MKVLTWEHKHGTFLYDASTSEVLEKSARQILNELISEGYVYEPEDPMKHVEHSGIDMELAQLTTEEIDALPLESLQKKARKEKNRLADRVRRAQYEREDYDLIIRVARGEKVIDNRGRQMTAWRILQDRSGYEYEVFDVQSVWTPGEDD